jgi:outer membrane protein OmpA-like peptidoglycan-associated protein
MKTTIHFSVAAALCMVLLTGCATNEDLKKAMAGMAQRVSALDDRVGDNRREIGALQKTSAEQEARLAAFSATAQEALQRAEAAEKLAVGTLLSEAVFSEEHVPFALNSAALSDEARAAVDAVARRLIEDNKGVYVEVQGFTDNSGTDAYNLRLGKKRAAAVLRHLYETHHIPLQRMRAYSYGETRPLVPNDSRENRMKNRRVAIIVMK